MNTIPASPTPEKKPGIEAACAMLELALAAEKRDKNAETLRKRAAYAAAEAAHPIAPEAIAEAKTAVLEQD